VETRNTIRFNDFHPKIINPLNYLTPKDLKRKRNPKPNQEVNTMSNTNYDELTQALPLLGMRVMINPKFDNEFSPEYRGITGTIVNIQGDQSTINNVIQNYKKGKSDRWSVSIRWDEDKYGASTIHVGKMLPVFGVDKPMHKLKFNTGFTALWTDQEYEENIDRYLIIKGYKIIQHDIHTEESRRKIFESIS
jgi:hypothetical protein